MFVQGDIVQFGGKIYVFIDAVHQRGYEPQYYDFSVVTISKMKKIKYLDDFNFCDTKRIKNKTWSDFEIVKDITPFRIKQRIKWEVTR